jgi:nucleotide-binding universal stress UspA family protein
MKKILVPIDFSKPSDNAVIYASNMAKHISARLLLFHSYHVPIASYETGYIPPTFDMDVAAKKEMSKYAKKIKSKFPTMSVNTIVKMGFAGDLIEETAKEVGADLIVMGITGHAGILKEHLVGSISTQVARDSSIPVLIVPEGSKFKELKRIGFACDYDLELEKNSTINRVKNFCDMFNAELEILNVEKPNEEVSVEKSHVEDFVEEKLKTVNHKTYFITEEEVDKGLLELVSRNNIDMVITCPKKHNLFHSIFIESNTEKLAFHSPVPVLGIHCI